MESSVLTWPLYGWHRLADNLYWDAQGCIGMYDIGRETIPANASNAVKLIELPDDYSEPFNPFEQ